eukprot:TRINITY_DN888_c0_g1_i4.p1 TRINITY_DN888_c0_g1~~TRINITY_DN888_c0_g1_i4.p1  ORF type:complete len:414 (+),score=63.99 TRINITY_DN888_c0_g1_i4:702-1943(+)
MAGKQLALALVGPGLIGKTFINQLHNQSNNLNVKLYGVANSKKMLIDENGIELSNWEDRFLNGDTQAISLDEMSSMLQNQVKQLSESEDEKKRAIGVMVDCTANNSVSDNYATWLKKGLNVVTPNKRLHSGDLARYKEVQTIVKQNGDAKFFDILSLQTLGLLKSNFNQIIRSKMLKFMVIVCVVVSTRSINRQLQQNKEFKCPPPGFDAVKPFTTSDLKEYISAPWFIQQQVPLSYQPLNQLYCVRAQYIAIDENDLSKGITVINYSDKDRVNNPSTPESEFTPLLGLVPNPEHTSKLKVGPPFLKSRSATAFGDYWIIAVGQTESDKFEWAIVSGGPPTRKTKNGCATGVEDKNLRKNQTNGIGFWLLSRKQVASQDTIKTMREKAEELGYDTSELVKVQQKGCLYKRFRN